MKQPWGLFYPVQYFHSFSCGFTTLYQLKFQYSYRFFLSSHNFRIFFIQEIIQRKEEVHNSHLVIEESFLEKKKKEMKSLRFLHGGGFVRDIRFSFVGMQTTIMISQFEIMMKSAMTNTANKSLRLIAFPAHMTSK